MRVGTITIARRFRGPANSGNGGYVSGRLAAYVDGAARVRLLVPPPLDVPLEVRRTQDSVALLHNERPIAEAWPASLDIDVPPSPGIERALAASRHYVGFQSHRFSTCFVCGTDREPGDALRVFAGPVEDAAVPGMVACAWTPDPVLGADPLYVWCVLDCPGGFSFPHPDEGTILLGELTVRIDKLPVPDEPHVVAGWETGRKGRKHFTGTALYTENGACLARGSGVWFEVPDL